MSTGSEMQFLYEALDVMVDAFVVDNMQMTAYQREAAKLADEVLRDGARRGNRPHIQGRSKAKR